MNLLRVMLVFIFSGLVALCSFQILRRLEFTSSSKGKRRMAAILTTDSLFNRYGERLLRLTGWQHGGALEPLESLLLWKQLMDGGSTYTPAGFLVLCLSLGLLGLLLAAAVGDPWILPLPLILAYLPYDRLKRKVDTWKRKVTEQLGDFTRNVAARMSTGTPLLTAVEQFAGEPGELPSVLHAEIRLLLSQQQNVFTFIDDRGRHQGHLAASIRRWRHPDLNRFARKMDQISMSGVNQVDFLYTEANSFSRHYQRVIGKSTEKLRIQIILPLAVFFFIPLLLAAFVPLLLSISL